MGITTRNQTEAAATPNELSADPLASSCRALCAPQLDSHADRSLLPIDSRHDRARPASARHCDQTRRTCLDRQDHRVPHAAQSRHDLDRDRPGARAHQVAGQLSVAQGSQAIACEDDGLTPELCTRGAIGQPEASQAVEGSGIPPRRGRRVPPGEQTRSGLRITRIIHAGLLQKMMSPPFTCMNE